MIGAAARIKSRSAGLVQKAEGMRRHVVRREEQTLQRHIADYLDRTLGDGAVWFAVPNGGGRSKAEAGILKATGVKAGVPDLCIIARGRPVFVELKAGKGRESEAQKLMRHRLTLAGAVVHLARSLDDVRNLIEMLGIPTRDAEINARRERHAADFHSGTGMTPAADGSAEQTKPASQCDLRPGMCIADAASNPVPVPASAGHETGKAGEPTSTAPSFEAPGHPGGRHSEQGGFW